jgi:hypothetical protein
VASFLCVNQGGKRVVRWHMLVILFVGLLSGALLGSCGWSYFVMDEWRDGIDSGLAYGMAIFGVVIGIEFTKPVEKFQHILPR